MQLWYAGQRVFAVKVSHQRIFTGKIAPKRLSGGGALTVWHADNKTMFAWCLRVSRSASRHWRTSCRVYSAATASTPTHTTTTRTPPTWRRPSTSSSHAADSRSVHWPLTTVHYTAHRHRSCFVRPVCLSAGYYVLLALISRFLFSPLGMIAERAIYFTSSSSLQLVLLSPSLLGRLSPSLLNVYDSSPVFIAIVFFFDLGNMLINWDMLLILL